METNPSSNSSPTADDSASMWMDILVPELPTDFYSDVKIPFDISSLPLRKLSCLVKIEGLSDPAVRMNVEVRTLEELIGILSSKFGSIAYVSYYDKDFKDYAKLESLDMLPDLVYIYI